MFCFIYLYYIVEKLPRKGGSFSQVGIKLKMTILILPMQQVQRLV